MYSVEPEGAAPRPWSRRRAWPWWLLIVAAAGIGMAVPSVRTALTGGQAGSADAKQTAPAAGYNAAQGNNPVQVAATGPQATGTALPAGYSMTSFGPLGPVDREFLTKVRQAGLWEGPAGTMAQTKAADERVKEVGRQLATDHKGLDQQVRQVSAQLGVPLPDKPSDEQQGWLNEMNAAATPQQFDDVFSNRLRAAHGKVFALVSQIRSGTRNELVRTFAQTAVNVVMKHMTLLESIGNVNFAALPEPVSAASSAAKGGATDATFHPDAIWAVAGLAVAIGAIAAFRMFRGSRGSRRRPAY
ncbi:DUF4142 domain-containing protein [Dactylosporangium vinaceum]|uniref:DUF4142 domain-containing protein n=1 Tax=Dactylosporangium vinaceum TaxID=53362 RepID=A0ABV5MQG9_9ACTN|nr:DUF4142 domain-containing protein [Dactylosporangium vinaceum]UAB96458.1 DUF4142 domain-containing protein [Dactylosporangium vinaceum]